MGNALFMIMLFRFDIWETVPLGSQACQGRSLSIELIRAKTRRQAAPESPGTSSRLKTGLKYADLGIG